MSDSTLDQTQSPAATGASGPPPGSEAELRARRTAERERDAAEASRDRFAFLAEVSRCLADSLDYESTLTTVAGMSLPYLGAWCIVDLLEEDGKIRRLAVLHPDPRKQELARTLHQRYPPRPEDSYGAPRVLRSGRPEMVFEVSDDALVSAARDDQHLALLRELGTRSYVVVPMVARGRTLGAMTFVTADNSRRFGDVDVVIAEDLARRAAMAIDNAMLYREALEARTLAEDATLEVEAALESANEAALDAEHARSLAEDAVKVRGEFLATMSHELRTPLNAILGYLELLELDFSGELTDAQRSHVQRARDSSLHLRRLLDDVLDVEKMRAGSLTVVNEPAPAAQALQSAIAIIRPLAAARLVRLRELSAEPVWVHADEHRVRQVLINLLSNAVKFSPAGSEITVETFSEPRHAGSAAMVAYRVRDAGRGVAESEREAIFEPFVQGQAGLTRTVGGAGLGLAIGRRLARMMGGDLLLEPPDPDVPGASFVLRLPAATGGESLGEDGADAGARVPDMPAVRGDATRRAARVGLAAVSEALLGQLASTLEDFIVRARGDAELGVTDEMTDVDVADHLGTLLTDIANSLAVLGEDEGIPTERLSDGSRIQRLVGELHGAQRHRLGWSEEQLHAEARLIGEVCAAAIVRAAGDDPQARRVGTRALGYLLDERLRASLAGYRVAAGTAS